MATPFLLWGIPAHSSRYNGHLSEIHPFLSILVHWFLECRHSLLPSPVWPLPICLDSWTWYSRFLCNIALYSIRPCFYHQSHPQQGIVFALASSLHSFWSYFSTDLQWHIGHVPTWEVPLSVSYHFAFLYCSWGSQGKNTEVVCHSLLPWTTFCKTSPPWPSHLGWPHRAWLSFIELDKAMVRVIRVASFLWLWFSVSALWCPLATPTDLLGFLLPWVWGISSQLLQQSAATAPYLGCGIAPLSRHPDLGHWVAPLGRRPWPPAWGSSSTLVLEVGCISIYISFQLETWRYFLDIHFNADCLTF